MTQQRDSNVRVNFNPAPTSLLGRINRWTAAQTFKSSILKVENPAGTFNYNIIASALAADRNLTLPLLTANDILVTEAMIQTLTGKTLTSPAITTPTGIVKGDVGLGNVDNTSDATKNAASVSLTNKTIASPTITGNITGGSGMQLATSAGDLVLNPTTKIDTTKPMKRGATSRHTYFIDAVNAAVADNTAAAILTFTVPYPSNYSTAIGAGITLQVTFKTNAVEGTSALMISTVILHFSIVRIRAKNAVASAMQFLSAVLSDELGTAGTHTALAITQFALVKTAGDQTAEQTWQLQFTNDYDPDVTGAVLTVAGKMETGGDAAAITVS